MAKMQNGILVKLALWIPYDGRDLESMGKARDAAEELTKGEKFIAFSAGATVESMYVAADAAEAAATKQFQEQAQGLYPALSAQIGAGQTVQNLTAPYFNVAEAITGVPASTMMADQQGGGVSKWAAFLQGGNNPAGASKTNVAPGMSNTTGGPQIGRPRFSTRCQPMDSSMA